MRSDMWRSCLTLAGLAIAGGSACLAVEPVTWGVPENGVRIAIAVTGNQANSQLKIIIENVGASRQTLLLEAGGGTVFQLESTEQDGIKHTLLEDTPFLFVPNLQSQMLGHRTETLEAGATNEVVLPLKKFFRWAKVDKITLDTILRRGGNLVVLYEVDAKWLRSASLPPDSAWTGRISAGPLHLQNVE
jgi:hypothetical protein